MVGGKDGVIARYDGRRMAGAIVSGMGVQVGYDADEERSNGASVEIHTCVVGNVSRFTVADIAAELGRVRN